MYLLISKIIYLGKCPRNNPPTTLLQQNACSLVSALPRLPPKHGRDAHEPGPVARVPHALEHLHLHIDVVHLVVLFAVDGKVLGVPRVDPVPVRALALAVHPQALVRAAGELVAARVDLADALAVEGDLGLVLEAVEVEPGHDLGHFDLDARVGRRRRGRGRRPGGGLADVAEDGDVADLPTGLAGLEDGVVGDLGGRRGGGWREVLDDGRGWCEDGTARGWPSRVLDCCCCCYRGTLLLPAALVVLVGGKVGRDRAKG